MRSVKIDTQKSAKRGAGKRQRGSGKWKREAVKRLRGSGKWKRGAGKRQRGLAAVEFALVLPVFLATTLGMIDLGRAYFDNHVVLEAARSGARVASLPTSSEADVTAAVTEVLQSAGIGDYAVTQDKAGLGGQSGETALVTVRAPYDAVSGTFIPGWSGRVWLTQTVKARHE